MIKTDICDLLQIEYPIFQGGMAWLGTAELASAVSEAGGLGIIGAGHMPPDVFRNEIHKVKERTSKPFGCNIMLMSPFVKEVMEVVVEERVPVITTGAGNPGIYIPALKEIGTKVIPVVASVLLAKRLLRGGIDALIAEGTESGGHVGDITTMALLPQVVDAVDVPVRIIDNQLAHKYKNLEFNGGSKEELENLGAGTLRKAAIEGDVKEGSVMIGQIAGMLQDVKPCKDIIVDIMTEAEAVINNLQRFGK